MKIDPENISSVFSAGEIDKFAEEMKVGGDQPPCPFCGVPRVRKIDYIRCHGCGVNWMNGEVLNKDPRIERLDKFLTEARATAPPGKKKEGSDG